MFPCTNEMQQRKSIKVENHVGYEESNSRSLQRNSADESLRAALFETTHSVRNMQKGQMSH